MLQQAKVAPRWRKPWKEGKYYIEQYKGGQFVSALPEYVMETLKQLVVLLFNDESATQARKSTVPTGYMTTAAGNQHH